MHPPIHFASAVDLLQSKKWIITKSYYEPEEEHVSLQAKTAKLKKAIFYASDSTVEDSVSLVVHLIKAAILPPSYVDLQARGATVFESENEALKDKGSVIKDAVMEPDESRYITLAIHNCI